MHPFDQMGVGSRQEGARSPTKKLNTAHATAQRARQSYTCPACGMLCTPPRPQGCGHNGPHGGRGKTLPCAHLPPCSRAVRTWGQGCRGKTSPCARLPSPAGGPVRQIHGTGQGGGGRCGQRSGWRTGAACRGRRRAHRHAKCAGRRIGRRARFQHERPRRHGHR